MAASHRPYRGTPEAAHRRGGGVTKPTRVIESPYLTSREAFAYLQLPTLGALYHHIRENQLPVLRAGRGMRFDKRELDAWLKGKSALDLVRERKVG